MMGRVRLAVFALCALTTFCSAAFAGTPAAPGEALVVLKNGLAEPLIACPDTVTVFTAGVGVFSLRRFGSLL